VCESETPPLLKVTGMDIALGLPSTTLKYGSMCVHMCIHTHMPALAHTHTHTQTHTHRCMNKHSKVYTHRYTHTHTHRDTHTHLTYYQSKQTSRSAIYNSPLHVY